MKYKQVGNCPYCDAERGVSTPWGMSPQGWVNLKERHDNGHPENEETKERKECEHWWIQDAPIKVCGKCGYKPTTKIVFNDGHHCTFLEVGGKCQVCGENWERTFDIRMGILDQYEKNVVKMFIRDLLSNKL